ncbi:MAG: biotin--[acetyl-CoA-carboxylase] ligase [Desulfobulbia bacterium]
MSRSSFTVPEGFRAEILDKVDSTNSEALRRAQQNEIPGLWILARKQSQGRGREGRRWISNSGNLTTSLLLRPQTSLMTALQLSFVAGLALHRCLAVILENTDSAADVSLKWPNDVLINNRKVAGILLESITGRQDQSPYIAIGIGINVLNHPQDHNIQATDLSCYKRDLSISTIFEQLAISMDELLKIWNTGEGFEAVRRLWLEVAHKPGEYLTVKNGQKQTGGYFETIDQEGALRLKLKSGQIERILVGDVYFENVRSGKLI